MNNSTAKFGAIRLADRKFIMAHMVNYVDEDEYEEGGVTIYMNCGSVTLQLSETDHIPVIDAIDLISKTVVHVLTTGDNVDLRSKLQKPRY